jgi:hypothetical protein
MGAAPTATPTGNAGSKAAALSKIREAVKIFEQALPMLQTGSDEYNKLLSIIQTASKLSPPSAEIPGVQQTTLQGLQQSAQKNGMLNLLNRSPAGASAGGGGAPPAAGPPPPAMPPSLEAGA